MSEYLFVYGTLLPGLAPPENIAPVASRLRPVGEGFVRGRLYDLGGYPGAVPDSNSECKIAGAVMQLPDDANALRELDAYEGCDPGSLETSEYVRELQRVELVTGVALDCWFYRYNREPDTTRMIACGMWGR